MRSYLFIILAGACTVALGVPINMDRPGVSSTLGEVALSPDVTGVIAAQGRRGEAYFARMNQALAARSYERAIEYARALLASEPDAGLAFEVIGTAEFARGRRDEALAAFRSAVQVEPTYAPTWAKLGIMQLEATQLSDAERSLLRSVEIDPKYRIAHQRLGMLYEYQGQSARAISHYRQGLVGTAEEYLGVALPLARLLIDRGDPAEAIDVLAPRLPLDSSEVAGHQLIARAYLETGQIEMARKRFARLAELQPGARTTALGLAMVERESGRAQTALDQLDAILAANADWEPAIVERAETLLVLGREEQALQTLKRLDSSGPKAYFAEKRLAQFHIAKGNLERASEYLESAVREQASDPDIYTRLSEVHLARGLHERGRAVLEDAVKRFPDSALVHLRLGSYIAALGDYAAALPSLARANELAPNDAAPLVALGLAHARAGNASAAAETARRLHELHPERLGYAQVYATRLEAAGRRAEAINIYRHILRDHPDDPLSLNNLASVMTYEGRHDEAVALARRATSVAPDNGRVLDTLGWALYRAGDLKEARKVLSSAAKFAPEAAVVHYHLGIVLAELGREREAGETLRKALELGASEDWLEDAKLRLGKL